MSQLRPGVEPVTVYDILTTQRFPEHVVAPFVTRFSIDQGPPGGLLPYRSYANAWLAAKRSCPRTWIAWTTT